MFQRIGAPAYKANLDNTCSILNILNNPHHNFRSVHIAGTNGKGSVAHLLASILQEKGLKTGLYTSPHLKNYRERIRINGKKISREYVVRFLDKYKSNFEDIKPSFFEMTMGMAFKYFEEEKVDITIIEVGMGGRLDSTNVVMPELSVITNISHDHTQFLGNTIEKISAEKAEIIKKEVPVVIGEMQTETSSIFISKAAKTNSPIYFADQNFAIHTVEEKYNKKPYYQTSISFQGYPLLNNIMLPLRGLYQLKNLITTVQSVYVLNKKGYQINEEIIKQGIKNVIEKTGILGRWQVLSDNPLTICDIAHNAEGIKNIINQLKNMHFEKLHFVLGMVNDKDIGKILKLLPKNADYYFCKADIPRGMDASELAILSSDLGLKGNVFSSVHEAYKSAKKNADEKDLVFVSGSTFVVAEVI